LPTPQTHKIKTAPEGVGTADEGLTAERNKPFPWLTKLYNFPSFGTK
jgi:hypothetical protein